MVIYILTKFGDDWSIFVDARVLTSKLWTDGRTSDGRTDTDFVIAAKSDHNSSLSTPCSGELKMAEMFSKRIENTVGKGEIARYEQFLLFPQCFQKTCTADTKKPGLDWERVSIS